MTIATVALWLTGPLGTALFVLSPPVALRPWTLVTSVYAHAGLGHLVSNAVALLLVGLLLERRTTRGRFHAFFLGVGALAGVAQIAVSGLLSVGTVGVVGASGAVFGFVGYLLSSNRIAGAVVRPLSARGKVVAVVGVAALLTLLWSPAGSALVAHGFGLLVGLLAGRVRLIDVD
jgi:membrane associated rhomboid family serine protease